MSLVLYEKLFHSGIKRRGSQIESRETVIQVTAAQFLTLFSAGMLSAIPAPAATQVIDVNKIIFEMEPGSVAFTGGGVITLIYHGGSAAHTGSIPASVVTVAGASPKSITKLGPGVGANGMTELVGVGLDLVCASANFAAGNGTARVTVDYTIITIE